ncbi:MAG: hypothetical protein KF871_04690 [Hydrogenophaga sp.]|uniref:hypothetical protein n=1 Tax=Hydrogenophaga sp. TaxID=1904254 RepID=UPI001D48D9A5|nr:hypothetical protein [Hydrogenophaga sp.]MBX3609173.1 hypothetical protein [Hydrogenophaga sp.]
MGLYQKRAAACATALLLCLSIGHASAEPRPAPKVEKPLEGPVKIEAIPTAKAQCMTTNSVRARGAWQTPKTSTSRSDLFVRKESGKVVLGLDVAEGNMIATVMFPIGTDGGLASAPPIIDSNNKELKAALEQMAPTFMDSLGGGLLGTTFPQGKAIATNVDPCKPLGATLRPGGQMETTAVGYVTMQGRPGLLLEQVANAYCSTSEGVFDVRGGGWWVVDRASGLNMSSDSLFRLSSRGTVLAEIQSQVDCAIVSQ